MPAAARTGIESATLPDLALARRRFQLGAPMNLSLAGRDAGILRIPITARLALGEPPPTAFNPRHSLAQEIAEAGLALQKISLILRHWPLLDDGLPRPSGR